MKQTLQQFVSERMDMPAADLLAAAKAAKFRTTITAIYQSRVRVKRAAAATKAAPAPVVKSETPRASRLPKIAVLILYDAQLNDSEKISMLKAYDGIA